MGTFIAACDWDNDGFINRFASRTDALNNLSTWVSATNYTAWRVSTSGAGVTLFTEGVGNVVNTSISPDYFTIAIDLASTDAGILWKSGATYDITTTINKFYRVVCWVQADSTIPTANYRLRLYTNNYTTLKVTSSGTSIYGTWTKVSMTFQATASDNLVLEISNTSGAMRMTIGGIMVIQSNSAVADPTGYNVGTATSVYDNFATDVKSMNWQLGAFKPYQTVSDEGIATVTLDNSTGLYTPENSTSALYQAVDPGIKFEIGHWLGTVNNGYRVMYSGVLDSPPLRVYVDDSGANVGKVNVQLTAVSYKVVLDTMNFEYPYQATETNIGGLIKLVLGAAQTGTKFDVTGGISNGAGSVINYAPSTDASVWQIVKELTDAENGKFYLDRGGTAMFVSRYYSLGTATYYNWGNGAGGSPTANSGTITDTGTYKYSQGLEYSYGANYINLIRATAHPRTTYAAGGTVWQNTNLDYDIDAGGSGTVIVRLRDSLGRYTTASSLTLAAISFTAGTATTTVSSQGGKGYIIFDNSAGSVTATAGTVILTAAAASQTYDVSFEITNSSTALYGVRSQTYDFPAVSRVRDLRQLTAHIFRRDNQFQGYVYAVPFRNAGDGTLNAHQLNWSIGKRLRVDLDNLYHDRDYWVIGERHTWTQSGNFHETWLALEPTSSTSFWLAGVTGYSEAGVTTKAGY